MVKTTLYISEDLKQELARLAAETGRSEADLIREGIRLVLRGRVPPSPSAGVFASGRDNLSERVDELLEGFGRS